MRKKWLALALAVILTVTFSLPAYADTAAGSLTLTSTTIGLKPGESSGLFANDNNVTVKLTSANPAVATATDNMVTGVSFGRTTVTATASDGRTATCDIHVAYKGIDVSSHQGTISWSDIKNNGVDFAIIRDGWGDELPETQTDSQFSANYDGATANGIKVGVYHVSYAATTDDAVKEAQFCLSILNKRHLDYPVFIDFESSTKEQQNLTASQLSAIAASFCNTVSAAGYRPGIYSSAGLFNSKLNDSSLSGYDKWVAHFGADSPNYNGEYKIWQYTEQGGVPGISTAVDMDYSYQSYPVPVAAPVIVDNSILSDTGSTLTVKAGKSYTFKFTPNKVSGVPTFSTGNSKVIKVTSVTKWHGSYLVKITATGKGCTSVYSTLPKQKAARRCVVTVA